VNKPDNRFTAWLNTTMQSRQLSQAELARAVGVADAQVSRWRRGQVVPTVRSLQRLAETLDVPRVTLDRLAGYPVEEVADLAATDADPAAEAECQAYEAWYGEVLRRKIPRELWPVYREACAALADALGASFGAGGARIGNPPVAETADSTGPDEREERPFGFRR
jgi:transcriptional regulator with XRE-family HTH domain